MRPPGLLKPQDFAQLTDEELHNVKLEGAPGSDYWEWAIAEQEERQRAVQNRKADKAPVQDGVASRQSIRQAKIFWSWQSDTPGKTGRFLIREALKAAIDELKQASDIEEPIREALHLDHDIQEVTGSPDLARTIFNKIEAAEVVVADVTPIGEVFPATSTDKKLINSNVAIELGYALHARTDQNVLLVFNEHYGTHKDLPFDLRHKGGAIVFNLRPDADRKEIEAQRRGLKNRFVGALRPYLIKRILQPAIPFEEIPHTFNRAAYFDIGEVLTPSGPYFVYPQECLCYVRLIPKRAPIPPLELATLKNAVLTAPLLRDGAYQNVYHGLNRYGAIKCVFTETKLTASTQLFQNGEIWCVGASLIRTERDELPQFLELPFLSPFVLEQTYFDTVHKLIEFATERMHLVPPWDLELGLVGLNGVYLNWRVDGQSGPIYRSEIIERSSITNNKAGSAYELLLSFFSKVLDSIGERRPPNLYGFPPSRPNPHWTPEETR
jgi:hypothetical protein